MYRLICEVHSVDGGAVSTVALKLRCGYKPAKFYRVLNGLIDMGFIVKPMRGLVVPVNIYQWHMDEYADKRVVA